MEWVHRQRRSWTYPHDPVPRSHSSPLLDALMGGWTSSHVGGAFLAGYRAALRSLLGDPMSVQALAVTEQNGNHPRSIQTSLVVEGNEAIVTGEKVWCTTGSDIENLLVIASTGERDGRPQLRAILVPSKAATFHPMPPTPFVPEIGHRRVQLDGVRLPIQNVLPGDAWTSVVKPFRTVEDIHVHGALIAHGMAYLPDSAYSEFEQGLAWTSALQSLSREDPLDPVVHRGLAGVLSFVPAWFEQVIELTKDEHRDALRRDAALLKIAEKARAARLERARP